MIEKGESGKNLFLLFRLLHNIRGLFLATLCQFICVYSNSSPFFGFLFPSSPFTHDYYGIFGKERCAIYKFSPLLVRDELTTRARILTENKSRTKCSTAIRRHFIPHEKHPANVFLMRHLSCVNIYWWAYQVVFFASL